MCVKKRKQKNDLNDLGDREKNTLTPEYMLKDYCKANGSNVWLFVCLGSFVASLDTGR